MSFSCTYFMGVAYYYIWSGFSEHNLSLANFIWLIDSIADGFIWLLCCGLTLVPSKDKDDSLDFLIPLMIFIYMLCPSASLNAGIEFYKETYCVAVSWTFYEYYPSKY